MQTSPLLPADSQLVLGGWLGVVQVTQSYAAEAGHLHSVSSRRWGIGRETILRSRMWLWLLLRNPFIFSFSRNDCLLNIHGTMCKGYVTELRGPLSEGQVKVLPLTLVFSVSSASTEM